MQSPEVKDKETPKSSEILESANPPPIEPQTKPTMESSETGGHQIQQEMNVEEKVVHISSMTHY